jgi:hypothetical protein
MSSSSIVITFLSSPLLLLSLALLCRYHGNDPFHDTHQRAYPAYPATRYCSRPSIQHPFARRHQTPVMHGFVDVTCVLVTELMPRDVVEDNLTVSIGYIIETASTPRTQEFLTEIRPLFVLAHATDPNTGELYGQRYLIAEPLTSVCDAGKSSRNTYSRSSTFSRFISCSTTRCLCISCASSICSCRRKMRMQKQSATHMSLNCLSIQMRATTDILNRYGLLGDASYSI